MRRIGWTHILLVAVLAIAALLLIRLHVAIDQPAPIYKGTRSCAQQNGECQKMCSEKSSVPGGCMKECTKRHQQCLSTGCWIGADFRYCGLTKQ